MGLVSTAAPMAATASVVAIEVATLTNLRGPGQLVQFQEVGGDCRYFGTLDQSSSTIRIESKACHNGDGVVEQPAYTAPAKVCVLPVPAGTHFDLAQ